MALSDSEIQSLRRHLGYGNISVGGYPYTPDGFLELFSQVVAPNLQTALETTATTSVAAAGVTAITLASVTGIAAYTRLVIDVGDDAEIVTVRSVSGSAVTATFAKAHTQPYPVAIESGTAVLRTLLHSADAAYDRLRSSSITKTAGLKQLGKGEIEWFEGGYVLRDTLAHYRSIQQQISDLVRVSIAGGGEAVSLLEAY